MCSARSEDYRRQGCDRGVLAWVHAVRRAHVARDNGVGDHVHLLVPGAVVERRGPRHRHKGVEPKTWMAQSKEKKKKEDKKQHWRQPQK